MTRRPQNVPDLAGLERMARRVFASLPVQFREACGNVVFAVAEVAPPEVLDDLGIEHELDLLGLFEGVGRTHMGESHTGDMPNRIWLYRQAILDYWDSHTDPLERIVAHVLIHEIGHHMGFDDDDLYRIEDEAD